MIDVRAHVFQGIDQEFRFAITSNQKGVFAGSEKLLKTAEEIKLKNLWAAADGMLLSEKTTVFKASGDPLQVTLAEEKLLGLIGKPSGVATSARKMVEAAGGRIKVVCGAWKKVFPETKEELRQAIAIGGAGIRMAEEPFVYLDKNYARMLGGIGRAVKRAVTLPGRTVVIQLRGEFGPIADEANEAVEAGAGILMVDTGRIADLQAVVKAGTDGNWRKRVKIGFAGDVTAEKLAALIEAGADIVDVGRAIIDAPILDFRLDIKQGILRRQQITRGEEGG
ncbi:MAG: nicotinate-nucleotide pyrophosphorylase [Peptococcaceae bacterium]|nr:nicotinate-nucleotide pyrophosphorylase [Peptococcaceae bacterium]MDH7526366.1 nicotinate-nucleotide pyrophosphorylase [Peptococcaceae bacterium]